MKQNTKILAIESSCDETAAAVVENGITVLSNIISSQIDLHKKYGGVVPEIASRAHIENIIPVIEEALTEARMEWKDIDAIAVTQGPGLLGSLLVGVNTARTLAYLKNKPLIPVHHIEGHIYANFIREILNPKSEILNKSQNSNLKIINNSENNKKQITNNKKQTASDQRLATNDKPAFPLLALVVSGGHTSLILMKDHLKYKILGQTIDDAAGEVFDKVAKILGLGYPGGPIISKLAEKGDKNAYDFPRTDLTPPPKRDGRGYLIYPKPSLDFSFSGLKTAVLNEVKKMPRATSHAQRANFCASFQQTVIDILVRNSVNAIKMYKPKSFLLSGGVAANKELVRQLQEKLATNDKRLGFWVPSKILCTDNAAMIGATAYFRYKKGDKFDWQKIDADPNLKLN